MTNLQKTLIILAAFTVVSIVLSQTQTSYLDISLGSNRINHVPAQQKQDAAKIYVDASSSEHAEITINEGPQHAYVTNIYQSSSGSFYIEDSLSENGQTQFLPSVLKKTHAQISVTGPIARTRLTQVFKNTSNTLKSGVYVFPLPQDAAVDGLLMQIGDRRIEGQIERKEKAQNMFLKAKSEAKKASLITQLRPNMFTNHIANIPPNSEISVTIEYQQFIVQDQHNYELRLPLSITPRYESSRNENSQIQELYDLKDKLAPTHAIEEVSANNATVSQESKSYLNAETTINVTLNTGLPISMISSEHHPIKTTNTFDTEYKIELESGQVANKDFVLNWQMQAGYDIQAAHFTYQSNEHEYGLITLMPPKAETLAVKRNLVFILDVSGSMVGEAITQAKQAIAMAIEDLNPDDYFNIVTFSNDASRLWPQSQMAGNAFKDEALHYLYNLEANGGTEIKKALELTFSLPKISDVLPSDISQEYMNQILFMTDGSVGNEDELMQIIYQKLDNYRLFTVGIGNAPNAFFMQEAAIAGKGTFTYIGDVSMVKPKMQALLEKVKRPALRNLQLNIKDAQTAFGFEIYPSKIPDLYANEPLVLVYKRQLEHIAQNDTLPFSIQGEHLSSSSVGDAKNRQWSSQLPSVSVSQKQGIHKYWAKMKIQDLHRQLNMRPRHSEGYETLKTNIKEGITTVALEHQLVSQYTSLIAIDHSQSYANNHERKNKATLQHYQHAKLPQTANATSFYMLIALVFFTLALPLILLKPTKRIQIKLS